MSPMLQRFEEHNRRPCNPASDHAGGEEQTWLFPSYIKRCSYMAIFGIATTAGFRALHVFSEGLNVLLSLPGRRVHWMGESPKMHHKATG